MRYRAAFARVPRAAVARLLCCLGFALATSLMIGVPPAAARWGGCSMMDASCYDATCYYDAYQGWHLSYGYIWWWCCVETDNGPLCDGFWELTGCCIIA